MTIPIRGRTLTVQGAALRAAEDERTGELAVVGRTQGETYQQ